MYLQQRYTLAKIERIFNIYKPVMCQHEKNCNYIKCWQIDSLAYRTYLIPILHIYNLLYMCRTRQCGIKSLYRVKHCVAEFASHSIVIL